MNRNFSALSEVSTAGIVNLRKIILNDVFIATEPKHLLWAPINSEALMYKISLCVCVKMWC